MSPEGGEGVAPGKGRPASPRRQPCEMKRFVDPPGGAAARSSIGDLLRIPSGRMSSTISRVRLAGVASMLPVPTAGPPSGAAFGATPAPNDLLRCSSLDPKSSTIARTRARSRARSPARENPDNPFARAVPTISSRYCPLCDQKGAGPSISSSAWKGPRDTSVPRGRSTSVDEMDLCDGASDDWSRTAAGHDREDATAVDCGTMSRFA